MLLWELSANIQVKKFILLKMHATETVTVVKAKQYFKKSGSLSYMYPLFSEVRKTAPGKYIPRLQ